MVQDTATGFRRFSGYGRTRRSTWTSAPLPWRGRSPNGCCRRTSTTGPKPCPASGSACTRSTSSAPRPPWTAGRGVLSVYSSDHEAMGTTLTRCGNRRASVCPSCSRVYAADMFHLIRAGVVAARASRRRCREPARLRHRDRPVVRARPRKRDNNRRCRPHAKEKRCEHGRPTTCFATHDDEDPLLGQPLCWECYDYASTSSGSGGRPSCGGGSPSPSRRLAGPGRRQGEAAPGLRDAAVRQGRRVPAARLIHFHALIRLDGPKTDPASRLRRTGSRRPRLGSRRGGSGSRPVHHTPVFDGDGSRVLAFGPRSTRARFAQGNAPTTLSRPWPPSRSPATSRSTPRSRPLTRSTPTG